MTDRLYQSKTASRPRSQSTEVTIVLGILKGVWWLVALPWRLIFRRRKKVLEAGQPGTGVDRTYVGNEWNKIKELMTIGGESNFVQALILADKLLDWVLIKKGAPGQTLGDRLKASQSLFADASSYQQAWQGHKLRNQIAHENNFELLHFQAKSAIDSFYDALRGLGAL